MAGLRADEAPLYKSLADDIRERIRAGEFPVGDQIPTEHEICAQKGVSRTTVRQAVQALVSEGVLDRQQGRGTFVIAVPVKENAFFRPLPQSSFHFAHIESAWTPPSFEIANAFGLALDHSVFSMTRLRLEADRPLAVTRYFTSAESLKKEPITDEERSDATFDAILAARGVRTFRSNIMAELVEIGEADAKLLGVPAGSISIATQRVGFDAAGRAVRLSRTIMRPDRARLYWSLAHKQGLGHQGSTPALSVWSGPGD